MRTVVVMLFIVALFAAACDALADEKVLQLKSPELQVELDRTLLRFLASPDAILIKGLHERSENELLSNVGITTDDNGIPNGRFPKKSLAFHKEYEFEGKHRHVFVYHPCLHVWPGTQPETIVICDASYRPLDWKEVGGSPMFESAAFEYAQQAEPVLLITRKHRHTIPNPERGIYRLSLKNDKITPMSDIKWLYKDDAERAQYARWRDVLRQHQRANRNPTDEPSDARKTSAQSNLNSTSRSP